MPLAHQETVPALDDPTAVAVIGASCRFGPLSSPAAYWDLLVRGGTAVRHYSDEELVALGHDPADLGRPGFVRAGCTMPDADRFDAGLFGFNPQQARWLDPQQRILLELAWAALEDGGLAPDDAPGATGVFTSSARPTLPPVGITELDAAGMARFSSADRDFAATRIAHQLGTTGPALNVQTACSSSLVAVHLAVESLLGGESDTAVVAAVSLHLPQAGYPSSPDMILSPSGVCRPFDERADGTVFGNGGGAVVLRRLSDALRDGDPVRAVVRGSAVNNDGAARQHYQAPSPGGQAAALREALAVGTVAPASVGLIETHGTGTQLGDPVEFSAIREAYGDGAGACALGSAKSVVGHLNTAAGLAGLVKCVLALEQGLVPPQHGFDSPNPLLDLTGSRFFVPGTPRPWPVLDGPRRAAVSSFGIGGTNTHVVLEQAPRTDAVQAADSGRPQPLVLSARTPEALRRTAEQLAAHLEGPGRSAPLDAVARTLRDGRSRLPHRLGVVARDAAQAARALRDRAATAGTSRPGDPEGASGHADGDASASEAVRAWEAGSDAVPLPGAEHGPRLNLPGYSFDHSRSWPLGGPGPREQSAVPHRGMLDRNTSTLHGISFERDLDPGEPLVADHVVNGRPLLPAAAFVECVRAAAAAAAGTAPHRIEDLVLQQSAEVDAPLVLRAEVTPGDGALEVTVTSSAPDGSAGERERHVHVTARVPQFPEGAAGPVAPSYPALAAVRERCRATLPPDELYALFARHQVDYGPRYQVVTEFSYGEQDVLARLAGPEGTDAGDEVLAPALLDGALQTVIGFLAHDGGASERFLPFAVERLEVYGPLPSGAQVHARPRQLAGGGDRIRKFDITVLAPDGTVRAELTGLALRPTASPAAATATVRDRATDTSAGAGRDGSALHVLAPGEADLPPGLPQQAAADGPLVVLGGTPSLRAALADRLGPVADVPDGSAEESGRRIAELAAGAAESGAPARPSVLWLGAHTPSTAGPAAAVDWARDAVALLQALLRPLARTGAMIRVPYLADDPAQGVVGAGLAALGRSLTRENPRFDLCAVALPGGLTDGETATLLAAETSSSPATRHVLLDASGQRRTREYRPVGTQPGGGPGLREGGRYWINGHGRLGALLAARLVGVHRCDVVLIGRRERTDGDPEWERLRELARHSGGSVEHVTADGTDTAALAAVAARLTAQGRAPHGVFHCAGMLRDGFLLTKDPAAAAEVTRPKVLGAAALDAATAAFDLDFFVAYSSVSASLGSEGQADYAFANAAMDRFAEDRAAEVRAGRRTGRTLSVAWPYWADGGMTLPGDPVELLGRIGAAPLPAQRGLDVLEELLAAAPDGPVCPLIFYGDPAGPPAALLPGSRTENAASAADTAGADLAEAGAVAVSMGAAPAGGTMPAQSAPAGPPGEDPLLGIVRGVLAEVTGHSPEDVDPDTLFDDLGVDSLTGIRAVDQLSERFGRLPRTLLFECRCAAEIVEHLRAELPAAELERAVAESAPETAPVTPATSTTTAVPVAPAAAAPAVPAEPDATVTSAAAVTSGQSAGTRSSAPAEQVPDPVDDGRAIAVIGLAGRFPEADGLDAFWQNLLDGRDSITEIPADRWPLEGFFRAERDVPNTSYAKWGGFLDGIDRFDAPLFNISAREAGTIDPQARLFLESCWAAIEDTGYTPAGLAPDTDPRRPRDVGVYVGAMYSEYQVHEGEERLRGNAVHANSAFWCIANRASYFFGFEGPSVAVDTACSSGLSSLHLACQALRAGECAVAVAGAVNVSVHPNKYLMLSQGRFLASEGRCRSFGTGGDGYVPGEGVGAVVLKPLAAALRDGDPVHAVIRGSAVNHGGRTNGYTVPNPKAQANLVGKALADAGMAARDLNYVETHGTGTSLGDPLEIRGLTSAFARDGWTAESGDGCPVGSVKSNIGHLESAAGMAAFAKVLLQFRHRTLVPSLHSDPPNPEIDFTATPFTVQQHAAPWAPTGPDGKATTLRAGISSFGAGGANAHVVVEEGPQRAPAPPDDGRELTAFLSARTPAALAELAGRMRSHLRSAWADGDGPARADVVHTLAVGRAQLNRRAAVRHRTREELLDGLARIEAQAGDATPESADDGHGPSAAEWLSGKRVDLAAASGAQDIGRRISLPHYPFERIRCWYDNQLERQAGPDGSGSGGEDRVVRGHLRDFGRTPQPEKTAAAAPSTSAAALPAAPPVPTRPVRSTPEPAPPSPVPARPRLDAAHVRETLLDALGEVLYEDPAAIGEDTPFEEMGLDSLLTEELIVAARERLGLELDVSDLFSYTTVARLARYLAESGKPVAPADAAHTSGGTPVPGDAAASGEAPDGEADAVLDALASGGIGLDEAVALLETSR